MTEERIYELLGPFLYYSRNLSAIIWWSSFGKIGRRSGKLETMERGKIMTSSTEEIIQDSSISIVIMSINIALLKWKILQQG